MKIAVYGRLIGEKHLGFLETLIKKIIGFKFELTIHSSVISQLSDETKKRYAFESFSTQTQLQDVNFLFSIGGDGTLLDAITFIRGSGIPVLGINTGRLGFLSSISIEEMDNALQAIINKAYVLDSRTLLRLETSNNIYGELNFALNEFTVHKQESASMITIHAYLDDEYLNSYWADGLIVSTPTGSTAYSLSCGGPIMMPQSENFIINPIAPHNLNVRPIVIRDSQEITLKLEGRTEHFLIALDSRSKTIDASISLKIKKENFTINLLRLKEHDFLSTIRNKMMWGADKRN